MHARPHYRSPGDRRPKMTGRAMPSLSTSRAGAAHSLDIAPDRTQRRPSAKLMLNAGGWLLFGAAMMIGSLDVAPWDVILATESVYVLIGFLLSLLLGRVYRSEEHTSELQSRLHLVCR